MCVASLTSGSLSVGASVGIAIGGLVVSITLCAIIIVIVTCYHKSKRSQNVQMSRIASATAVREFQSDTLPQASAPAAQENADQPPPSYITSQQQYPSSHPGNQYEMQQYPQYPEYPPGYPLPAPYPDHATYPQQYYPAVGDTSKYYPQQLKEHNM